jgi:hypothetical protein
MPDGGPQALGGYTYINHPHGFTRLAIGTIGNMKVANSGTVIEARPVQSEGEVTGDDDVFEWNAYTVSRPKEKRRGQVKRFNAIKFGNGWTFVEQGEQLLLCPPGNARCRAF